MWRLLQVIRACRNRPHVDLLRPIHRHVLPPSDDSNNNLAEDEPTGMVGEKRIVVVRRKEGQGLGISITVSYKGYLRGPGK